METYFRWLRQYNNNINNDQQYHKTQLYIPVDFQTYKMPLYKSLSLNVLNTWYIYFYIKTDWFYTFWQPPKEGQIMASSH